MRMSVESSRSAAWRMRDMHEADLGGTFQACFERNAVDEALVKRLVEPISAMQPLCLVVLIVMTLSPRKEAFHIGRLAVSDEDREPVVVDWRALVAEPFYR